MGVVVGGWVWVQLEAVESGELIGGAPLLPFAGCTCSWQGLSGGTGWLVGAAAVQDKRSAGFAARRCDPVYVRISGAWVHSGAQDAWLVEDAVQGSVRVGAFMSLLALLALAVRSPLPAPCPAPHHILTWPKHN